MSIFKRLFGKKKTEESDGQEEFFKDDFAPVIKRHSSTKHNNGYVEPLKDSKTEEKKVAESGKEKKAEPKPKKKAPQKATQPISPSRSNVVKPTNSNVGKLIYPSSAQSKAAKSKPDVSTQEQQSKSVAKASAKATKPTAKLELRDDSPELKGAVAVEEGRATANGKFDIQRAKDGRFFFTLYASNHTAIAYSQLYSSSSGATTGINSVIANSPKAGIEDTTLKNPTSLPCPKWEIYLDKAEQYRFRLYAPNGQCVCHASHGYTTKSGCKGGIESIKRFSAEARVDKSYLK